MTDPATPEEEEALAALTILDFFAYLVDDDDAAAARERHCEVVSSALENVASWLAVDAWLGAGDVQDTTAGDQPLRVGGHPHPSGRQLMELPRSMGRLERAVSGETRALDTVRALWLDFTFHCDRTWRALTDLLAAEHARFEHVGRTAKSIEAVVGSRVAWQQSDTLGLHAGLVLEALRAGPTTRLRDLLNTEE